MTGSKQHSSISNTNSYSGVNKPNLPKDAHIIIAILKDLGVHEYESKVVNQLLDFTYRYVTGILEDARIYAGHAKKKQIDIEDIKLAVRLQTDRSFTSPPPRDLLLEIARVRNANPLPPIKPHCGIRLPPDRYCLTSSNLKLKGLKKPPVAVPSRSSFHVSCSPASRQPISTPAVSFVKQGGTSIAIPTNALMSSNISSLNTKPKIITMPKPGTPLIRMTSGRLECQEIFNSPSYQGQPNTVPKVQVSNSSVPMVQSGSNLKFENNTKHEPVPDGNTSIKRKRDAYDDYDEET